MGGDEENKEFKENPRAAQEGTKTFAKTFFSSNFLRSGKERAESKGKVKIKNVSTEKDC